ncbi:MAG: nuclease-related domain-containing protein [Protaetiibacter sp.]
MEPTTDADREMNLRFAGVCTVCGDEIPQGARAVYSPSSRSVRHTACPGLERGAAGASARREFERRKARDDARVEAQKADVRANFGDGFLGKVAMFLAVDDSPRRSTSVWAQGAVGEERVAAQLDALAEVGVIALHDRRIPGTKANIDHIAVTPWGVWVIDAKRYLNKRPELVTEGGFLGIGGTDRLTVGGRKQDKLVDGMLWQVERVQSVLGGAAPARGVLCFVEADWPLIGGHFSVRGVRVVWPRRLPKELLQTMPPTIDAQAVARTLASAFPRA